MNLRAAGGGVLGRTDNSTLSMTALMKATGGDLMFKGVVEDT